MPMPDDFNPNIHDHEYWGESEDDEPMLPDTVLEEFDNMLNGGFGMSDPRSYPSAQH